MKVSRWGICFGAALVAVSAALYLLHYALFRDAHHILIYLLGDIAFLPIEVLLVTLILHRVLTLRERRAMLRKLNMVIGAFYSEVGTRLLSLCVAPAGDAALRASLGAGTGWTHREFDAARARAASLDAPAAAAPERLREMKAFLEGKREFLLRLLENPNLLEHESFTDLLWAVLHLSEELSARRDLGSLSARDREHLGGDVRRVQRVLLGEWISYLEHLKSRYPYLFSLAVRTNPFDPSARPEIE